MNIFSLEKKNIVVFGGAGYLGGATVEALLGLGARVLVADAFPDYTSERKKQLEGMDNCVTFKCDARESGEMRAAYQECEKVFGSCSGMINFVSMGAPAPIETMTDEDFAFGVDMNLGVAFRSIREGIPFLSKHESSAMVLTASMYGVVSPDPRIYGVSGQNSPPNYGPPKAGVIQLTRYAAGHLAPKGIRVNCVTPGPFPDARKLPPEEFLNHLSNKTMLGRIGKNTEIAGAYCYLISDAASFTTGENIVVDGGWTAW